MATNAVLTTNDDGTTTYTTPPTPEAPSTVQNGSFTWTTPTITPPPPAETPTYQPVSWTPPKHLGVSALQGPTPSADKNVQLAEEAKLKANALARTWADLQKGTSEALGKAGLGETSIANRVMGATALKAMGLIEEDRAAIAAAEAAANEQLRKEGVENLDTILTWAADGKIPASAVDDMITAAQSGDWAKVAQIYKDNEIKQPVLKGQYKTLDEATAAVSAAHLAGTAVTMTPLGDGSYDVEPLLIVAPDGTKSVAKFSSSKDALDLSNLLAQAGNKRIISTYDPNTNTITYSISDQVYDPKATVMTIGENGVITYTEKSTETVKEEQRAAAAEMTANDYWAKVNNNQYATPEDRLAELKLLVEGPEAENADLLLDYYVLTGGKRDVQGLSTSTGIDSLYTAYVKKQGTQPLDVALVKKFIADGSSTATVYGANRAIAGDNTYYNEPNVLKYLRDNSGVTTSVSFAPYSTEEPVYEWRGSGRGGRHRVKTGTRTVWHNADVSSSVWGSDHYAAPPANGTLVNVNGVVYRIDSQDYTYETNWGDDKRYYTIKLKNLSDGTMTTITSTSYVNS